MKRYSSLSTAGAGTRDLSYDLSDWLESGESPTGTPTVTAAETGLVTISSVSYSGNTVVFSVTAVANNNPPKCVRLYIDADRDAGSSDVFEVELPLVARIN